MKILFFLFYLFTSFHFKAYAREEMSFAFSTNKRIHILSDKAYRRSTDEMFEAVGNVVITQDTKALYGEKASMSTITGDINIFGNVRYITPGVTMYGTSLFHNLKNDKLIIKNARILSDNFVVLGQELSKVGENEFYGKDAEYTTCRDCPESWSILGKEVNITIGEYVKIKHAYLKVKGVVVLYVPYIIFPIKKKRETGLLFPDISTSSTDGVRLEVPWFWAMSRSSDLTLTPSILSKRGYGNILQYRKMIGHRKWLEINSLQVMDNIYLPNKFSMTDSGKYTFRHFSQYEHRYDLGNVFRHHLYINEVSDLDTIHDLYYYAENKIRGSEIGMESFIDLRFPLMNIGIESYYNKNQLVDESDKFDTSYVQILPKIFFNVIPFNILETDLLFLKNIKFGIDSDVTVFKQSEVKENLYIRNAQRLNWQPYINWSLGNIGPVKAHTKIKWDNQNYNFPNERDNRFSKTGIIYESEFSIELEKIFGVSYMELVPTSKIIPDKKNQGAKVEIKKQYPDLVGDIPSLNTQQQDSYRNIVWNSYRHSQEFKLKHFYLSDQKITGNDKFKNQIRKSEGRFDYLDSIREKEYEVENSSFKQDLPLNNTLEFQWNNSLIKKQPISIDPNIDKRFINQNFSYSKISYFNISQGYDLNLQSGSFVDRLTRLKIATSLSLFDSAIGLTEYYFYKQKAHLLSLNISRSFTNSKLVVSYAHDSTLDVASNYISVTGESSPVDLFTLKFFYNYDIGLRSNTENKVSVLYKPYNKCWQLKITRSHDQQEEEQYSFNFVFNFNDNNFESFTN